MARRIAVPSVVLVAITAIICAVDGPARLLGAEPPLSDVLDNGCRAGGRADLRFVFRLPAERSSACQRGTRSLFAN